MATQLRRDLLFSEAEWTARQELAAIAIHQRDRGEVALKDFGRADFEAWVRKLNTITTNCRE